jgi:hypothetical protein
VGVTRLTHGPILPGHFRSDGRRKDEPILSLPRKQRSPGGNLSKWEWFSFYEARVLAPFRGEWPVLNLLVAYFANGEQMSRLSSVLGACCPNHRLRPRPTRRG